MTDQLPASTVGEAAAPRRRLFYGWIVVACGFVVLLVAYGIQFSFGVFMPVISADTGWDRGSLSLPYSLYVFVYSMLGIVSGRLTDRLGPRTVLILGGGLLAGGLMLVSEARTLRHLYLALGLIAAAGMSAAYVPCNATVVRWFIRQRGLALSITSSGASFGMFVFPPLTNALIRAFGWREAYFLLGVLAVVTIAVCGAFVVRDPEERGLQPDGDTAPSVIAPTVPRPEPGADWTLTEARRTSAFWLLTAIFALTWLVVFMPLVHIVPFALDLGVSQLRAAMSISVIGLAGFVGRLAAGPVSDRLGRSRTLAANLLLQALSFVGFTYSRGLGLLYPSAAVFGLSYGGITALFPALVGDFFGRLAIGAIVGFIFAAAGSPAAFGPLIAGLLYDASRSYKAAFELSTALNLAALGLLGFLHPPRHHEHAAALV